MTNTLFTIRRATRHDIPAMLRLINSYAAERVMLPRTESELAAGLHEFVVAQGADTLLGCGALHPYANSTAEVRSLAVEHASKAAGVGRAIVQALLAEAQRRDLDSVFAFTYVDGFFSKLGFTRVTRDLFPQKTAKDCLRCPKFAHCDEIPMLHELRAPGATGVPAYTPAPIQLYQIAAN